jgi:hypothetical protein
VSSRTCFRRSSTAAVTFHPSGLSWRLLCRIGIFILLSLMGCNRQQTRMESALNAYIGRSVAEFAADHGDPTSVVKLSDTETAFRWVITGQGRRRSHTTCTVSLRATAEAPNPELKDWIIQGWNWQGAC